jgi:hypothetical protein
MPEESVKGAGKRQHRSYKEALRETVDDWGRRRQRQHKSHILKQYELIRSRL